MDIKTGEAGFGIFKGNPKKSTFPELGHQSYDTAIPGEYFGGLTASVPPEIMFPKTFDSLSKIKECGWARNYHIMQQSRLANNERQNFLK